MISSWDIDAEFSPDGRTLAFSSSRSGEAMEIGYFAGRRWW